jgi:hypothetical protein
MGTPFDKKDLKYCYYENNHLIMQSHHKNTKLPQICVIIQITSQFEPFDNVNATTKYTFWTKYMLLSLQNNCKTVG